MPLVVMDDETQKLKLTFVPLPQTDPKMAVLDGFLP
jgi:hypothetical protein